MIKKKKKEMKYKNIIQNDALLGNSSIKQPVLTFELDDTSLTTYASLTNSFL